MSDKKEIASKIMDVLAKWDQIFLKALQKRGAKFQMDMAVEECAEFIVAAKQFQRGRCEKDAVIDEIADVSIMMLQMAIMFSVNKVKKRMVHKMNRLEKRVDEVIKREARRKS
jgi:phosphoribosyl-ATP pyrophosphohydrolase